MFWELIKYKIRQDTMSYSKAKARERRAKLTEMEKKLKHCQVLCDQDPSIENINNLEIFKS